MGERLDESVVGRLPRAGEVQRDAALIGPDVEIARHELGAVVGNDRGFAPSGDDRREFARNPLSGDRRVRDCAQTFLGGVVDDVQDTEEPAVGELVNTYCGSIVRFTAKILSRTVTARARRSPDSRSI